MTPLQSLPRGGVVHDIIQAGDTTTTTMTAPAGDQSMNKICTPPHLARNPTTDLQGKWSVVTLITISPCENLKPDPLPRALNLMPMWTWISPTASSTHLPLPGILLRTINNFKKSTIPN